MLHFNTKHESRQCWKPLFFSGCILSENVYTWVEPAMYMYAINFSKNERYLTVYKNWSLLYLCNHPHRKDVEFTSTVEEKLREFVDTVLKVGWTWFHMRTLWNALAQFYLRMCHVITASILPLCVQFPPPQGSVTHTRRHHFNPMPNHKRKLIHELSPHYGCETLSYDTEPQRYVSLSTDKWVICYSILWHEIKYWQRS